MTVKSEAVELDRWVSAKTIAHLFDVTQRYVAEDLSKRTGFPKPLYVGRVKRWRLDEVLGWVKTSQI